MNVIYEPSHAIDQVYCLASALLQTMTIKAMHCIHPRAPASIARAVLDHEII